LGNKISILLLSSPQSTPYIDGAIWCKILGKFKVIQFPGIYYTDIYVILFYHLKRWKSSSGLLLSKEHNQI